MSDRVWTDEKDAELLDRIEAGESFSAAALAMGVTKNAAVGRYNRIERKQPPPLNKIWPLTLCSELPVNLTDYVPVNPHAGKRAFT